MDKLPSGNGPGGSSNPTESAELYAQAQQQFYEQQLVSMASLNAGGASSMMGFNPFLMGAFGGMNPYASLGMLGDYQAQLAATMNPAALYGSLGMGGMGFSPAEFAAAYAALGNGLSPFGASTSSGLTGPQHRRVSSPATGKSSSPRSHVSHSPSLGHARSDICPTPKSDVSKKSERASSRPPPSSSATQQSFSEGMASFYKGLSSEEFDVNSHFKNSLGSLYNEATSEVNQPTGLDLSKKKPDHKTKHSKSATTSDSGISADLTWPKSSSHRTSVIKTPASSTLTHSSQQLSESPRESISPKKPSITSPQSQDRNLDNTSPKPHGSTHYDAMPNLKRLSEQLKTEGHAKPLTSITVPVTKQRHVVSLLKPNTAASSGQEGKTKVRKGKQPRSQKTAKNEESTTGHSLQTKESATTGAVKTKATKRPAQTKDSQPKDSSTKAPRAKKPRKTSQKPRSGAEPVILEQPVQEGKRKRKQGLVFRRPPVEKPVDMVKLRRPFEYGWRRETRIRGINKLGKFIGEVFYYTPTDKRMRSYNDVTKWLNEEKQRVLNPPSPSKEDQSEESSGKPDQSEVISKQLDQSENSQAVENSQEEQSSGKSLPAEEVKVIDTENPKPIPEGKMETENSPKQISEREATVLPSQTVSNSTDVQIENGPTPVSEPKLDKSASEPMEVNAEATNVGAETTSVEVESTNSKVEPKTNQEAVVENGCMDTSTSSPTESEHPKNKQPAIPVWEALTKDCFSFNTKVKLGDFIELQQGEKVQYVTLTDEQRDKRIQTADAKRDKQLEKAQKAKMKKQHAKDLIKQKEIADADKRKRQIELAQKAVEEKLKKQMEKAKQRAQHELIKQQKALAQAMRKHALQAARDKDKMQKQAKAREILEERRKRQRDFKEAKARERMEKAMVKEKRRQLLMNSRLHEARKKEEERCRLHIERLLAKERRTELKRKELELIKSMKDPAEDLQLPGTKGLPAYSRITGLKLSGGAFADVLQAHQFITNFYDCLEFKQTIPTLDVFQQALLHDSERSESQLTNILCHMLQFAMKDPGVPNPKKFKNELEQNLLSCIIDEYSFTEIFRNFIIARTGGRGNEISEELQIKPFDSLSVGQRAHAIAWLCDELVTSKAVTEEIDSNMEDISGLKRDKWELEGKIREMRVVQDKVTRRDEEIRKVQTGSDAESDQENSRQLSSSVEGHGSVEEVDKKVEKMTKQHRKLCREVRRCAGTLRTLPFGMDRYRRYYWSLPSFKGTLVESKESSLSEAFGSPDDYAVTDAQPKPVKVKSDEKSVEGAAEMNGNAMDTNENDVKDEVKSDVKAEEGRTPGGIKKESSQLDSSQTAEPPNLSSTPSQPPRVNGAVGGHSITSWLNSTIDSIFEASIKSSPSSDLKPTTTTSLNTHSQLSADGSICATEEPCWFDLKKRIACSSISTCNPDTVSSSLAFPNNAAMTCYEDQQALDSYNKVAAKCALLEKPVEIPTDLQRGWWVITDFGEMRTLNGTLHQRGIRERILSRTLQKHSEQVEEAFSDSCMSKDIGLEVDSRDKQISQNPFCAPMADRNWNVQQCRDWELRILDRVEDLEERIYQGSMYTKNWEEGKRHDPNDLDLVITPMEEVSGQQKRIIDLVKEKLLQLESGIERRYLKPPFTKSHHLQLSDITSQEEKKNDESDEEEVEDKNRGLIQWQRAVRMAMNLSQLYLCLQQLENCVAWERSVMRVLCQICRSDDDEDQLLLCDSCDKGYHTYCFKPRMVNIPEGNWYCWECKSKATSVSHCVRCGKTTGKIAVCHKCPQAIHLECMKPAMQRMPRKYTCGHCSSLQNGGTLNRSKRKGKTVNYQDEKEDGSEVENSASGSEDSAETEEDNGLNECSNILSELEKHKDAVPFMQPVDTKAFPQYKKYIKQPMDLGTIRQKLQDNEYKNRSEFYDDVILVFDNCLMFNEDDSSVGKSGKTIRRQFLKRWKQIQ